MVSYICSYFFECSRHQPKPQRKRTKNFAFFGFDSEYTA